MKREKAIRPSFDRKLRRYLGLSLDRRSRRLIEAAMAEIESLKRSRDDAEHAQAVLINACIRSRPEYVEWQVGPIGGFVSPTGDHAYQEAVIRVRQAAGLDELGVWIAPQLEARRESA